MTGVTVRREDWDLERDPDQLCITFRVVDDKRRKLAEGKDLDALKRQLKVKTQAVITSAAAGLAREGLRTWTVGSLAKTLEQRRNGLTIKAVPALDAAGASVARR